MKLILNILLITLIILTLGICVKKPQMHKSVLVYNSDYKLVSDEDVNITQPAEIPQKVEYTYNPQTITKVVNTQTVPKTQTVTKPKVTTQKTTQTSPVQTQTVKTTTTPKTETTTTTLPKVVERVANYDNQTKTSQQQTQTQTQTAAAPATTQTTQKTVTLPRIMTEEQELIAWNIWRSNLQNKIMQDVRLPYIPNGTVFKFTFTVDKYGKITNVQTWSTNPAYTPYAIQYIAPVIRSYQGRSILDFPEGSLRTTTDVKGGWMMSENERYSSPSDYNDVEKKVK